MNARRKREAALISAVTLKGPTDALVIMDIG